MTVPSDIEHRYTPDSADDRRFVPVREGRHAGAGWVGGGMLAEQVVLPGRTTVLAQLPSGYDFDFEPVRRECREAALPPILFEER